jgi:hypothetical protein
MSFSNVTEYLINSEGKILILCFLLYRIGIASNQNDKALINNFWTMALGDFNKKVIEEINQKIHGKLVSIEQPEHLVEAYAQVAEIL